jgi:GT2 family glycosyltransferase
MTLAVIILNWNNAPDTIRCVRAIQAWQTLRPAIWVVDNGSSDDSVEQLRQNCPNIALILGERNLGFAAGNNLAIRRAMDAGASHLFLLNNDAVISEADVIQLMHTLETTSQAGVVGPLLRDPPPLSRLQAAGGRNAACHIVTHRLRLPEGLDPFPVDYVPGTAILIGSKVVREVGLLDERYFISGEIADFCTRARSHGFVCLIDPTTTAYHDTGRSSELREAFYAYYFVRNRFLYVRKFYPAMAVPLALYWSAFGLASVARAIVEGRRARARALWLALRHGLNGTFGDQSDLILSRRRGA